MEKRVERIKNLEDRNCPLIALVSVPIGNDADISIRAKEILEKADIICCEDTRMTGAFLKRIGIRYKELISLYSQVEGKKAKSIIERIKGTNYLVAFCSDAGTPGISDPGALLAKLAIEEGIRVTSIPGSSALISALIISGLDTADFTFYGFLSPKKEAKEKFLEKIKEREETAIFYESPVRVIDTLKSLYSVLGDRHFALLRELTKEHEEAIRGTLKEGINIDSKTILGECVICIEGYKGNINDKKEEIIKLYKLYKENGIKDLLASKLISKQVNLKKNDVYDIIKDL